MSDQASNRVRAAQQLEEQVRRDVGKEASILREGSSRVEAELERLRLEGERVGATAQQERQRLRCVYVEEGEGGRRYRLHFRVWTLLNCFEGDGRRRTTDCMIDVKCDHLGYVQFLGCRCSQSALLIEVSPQSVVRLFLRTIFIPRARPSHNEPPLTTLDSACHCPDQREGTRQIELRRKLLAFFARKRRYERD